MKKRIVGVFAIIAATLIMTINVSISLETNKSMDISLSNIEALAYELPETGITCSYPHCSLGYLCHRNTGDWHCYCEFTGRQANTCTQ
jgi:hypothetical protein